MHHVAILSEVMWPAPARTARRIRRRGEQGSAPVLHAPVARGAWRNWWTMNVLDEPPYASRQTRVVGARGRMVPPR